MYVMVEAVARSPEVKQLYTDWGDTSLKNWNVDLDSGSFGACEFNTGFTICNDSYTDSSKKDVLIGVYQSIS